MTILRFKTTFLLCATMAVIISLSMFVFPGSAHATTETYGPGDAGSFVVPAGVYSLNVGISGGAGAAGDVPFGAPTPGEAGDGGMFVARFDVTPGETFYYIVATNGNNISPSDGGTGWTVGGGATYTGASGGGSSALEDASHNPLIVAGGGGGGGSGCPGQTTTSGNGGNSLMDAAQDGGNGSSSAIGGHGATSSGDGLGDGVGLYTGSDGSNGDGGTGGGASLTNGGVQCGGGGGGAGYYGGGGGGSGAPFTGGPADTGGGGGGLSWIDDERITDWDFMMDPDHTPFMAIEYEISEAPTTTVPSSSNTPRGAFGSDLSGTQTSLVSSPGKAMTVHGTDFKADSDVVVTLHSSPVRLGVARTNASGSFVATYTLPKNTELGSHQIILTGLDSSSQEVSVVLSLSVVRLAATGSSLVSEVQFAASLLFIGGLIAFATKRRRRLSTMA